MGGADLSGSARRMRELFDETGQKLPARESPTEDALRNLGDLMFLAARSDRHRRMSVAQLQAVLEPPVALDQCRIFRFDGVPRGAMTWARMSRDAEQRLVGGHAIRDGDWQSGDRLWIVDLIAPYKGMTASILRWVMQPGNFAQTDFYFRRISGDRDTRRIVHIDFNRPEGLSKILTNEDFLG